MAGSSLMVPERRLYPWDTVVRCGSKDTGVPNSLDELSALCRFKRMHYIGTGHNHGDFFYSLSPDY